MKTEISLTEATRLATVPLVAFPEDLRITAQGSVIHIDAHVLDIGAILGKAYRNALAIQTLARKIDPEATLDVAREGWKGSRNDFKPSDASQWLRGDENRLVRLANVILGHLDPDASLIFRPVLKKSLYFLQSERITMDEAAALHVIMHGYAKRFGRHAEISFGEQVERV